MPQLPLDQVAQDGGVGDDAEPEDEEEAGDDGEEEDPEPEEDINLLIYHIDWQHAQGIVGLVGDCSWVSFLLFSHLDCPRESKLLEGAFGHPRKDAGHWVDPVLRFIPNKSCNLQAIGAELSPQKQVH